MVKYIKPNSGRLEWGSEEGLAYNEVSSSYPIKIYSCSHMGPRLCSTHQGTESPSTPTASIYCAGVVFQGNKNVFSFHEISVQARISCESRHYRQTCGQNDMFTFNILSLLKKKTKPQKINKRACFKSAPCIFLE